MNEFSIGTRIAELRSKMGMTQLELAEKLGVTDRAVSKWETGASYPDIALLPQLADIFGVTTDYLLRGLATVKQEFYVDYANSKFNDTVNKKYLANGWNIADMKLSGDGDGACMCAILFKKQICEE